MVLDDIDFQLMKNSVVCGDCLEVMKDIPDNSIDTIVTDPPYGLEFMGKKFDTFNNYDIPIDFGMWLAGFIDGEGNFDIHKQQRPSGDYYYCRFEISLRADDGGVLSMLQKRLGGKVYKGGAPSNGSGSPKQRWELVARAECSRLVAILDRYPLQSKKKRDFSIWREALAESMKTPQKNRPEAMMPFWERLRGLRPYGGDITESAVFVKASNPDGFYQFNLYWAVEALRVAKPGAMLLAFGGTRTWHRLACAIEDAGWEIRDNLCWLYGSGFPKSLDISKAIDKAAGAEREVVGVGNTDCEYLRRGEQCPGHGDAGKSQSGPTVHVPITSPATPLAQLWHGYGTALKPAHEPIIVAMKPLDGTFAQNAEKHGVAGLWIEGGRVGTNGEQLQSSSSKLSKYRGNVYFDSSTINEPSQQHPAGRWPANLILECTCEETQEGTAKAGKAKGAGSKSGGIWAKSTGKPAGPEYRDADGKESIRVHTDPNCPCYMLDEQAGTNHRCSASYIRTTDHSPERAFGRTQEKGELQKGYGDSGGPSRFFYTAKASRREREAGLEGMEERRFEVANHGMKDERWPDGHLEPRKTEPQRARNHHPTVKPLSLMRYLVRLTRTPTGGIVLDPFLGSGTTAIACTLEGREFIGIEQDKEYVEIAERRIKHWKAEKDAKDS